MEDVTYRTATAVGTAGRCIYCLASPAAQQTAPFNLEHVLPRCSAPQVSPVLLLKKLVCSKCNSLFGGFDWITSSLWYLPAAYMAFAGQTILLTPNDSTAGRKSVPIRMAANCEFGFLRNSSFHLRKIGDGFLLELSPVIAIRDSNGEDWRKTSKGHVGKLVLQADEDRKRKSELMLFGDVNSYVPVVEAAILDGWNVRVPSATVQNAVNECMLDTLRSFLQRAITKIAFNYFAWVAATSFDFASTEFPYSAMCDRIRNYVLYDAHRKDDVGASPVYVPDSGWNRPASEHRILFVAEKSQWGNDLVVYVTLFGTIRWRVVIAKDVPWWGTVASEHAWDFTGRRCRQVC